MGTHNMFSSRKKNIYLVNKVLVQGQVNWNFLLVLRKMGQVGQVWHGIFTALSSDYMRNRIKICLSRVVAFIEFLAPRYKGKTLVIIHILFLWRNKKKISTLWLTLKMPRKPASENVICLCRLLNIYANFSNLFCIQANSVDPDQTAKGDLKEQSDLGPHCLQKWLLKSQAGDKADDNCCDWHFKG